MGSILMSNMDWGTHVKLNAVAALSGHHRCPLWIRTGNKVCGLAGKGTPGGGHSMGQGMET